MSEDRGEVTGTLHVRRQRKESPGGLFAELVARAAEDAGLTQPRYYPPMLYMTNDETYDGEHSFIWKFRGVPKALAEAEDGSTVTVRATLDVWRNGIGAYLTRPQIVSVDPPAPVPVP